MCTIGSYTHVYHSSTVASLLFYYYRQVTPTRLLSPQNMQGKSRRQLLEALWLNFFNTPPLDWTLIGYLLYMHCSHLYRNDDTQVQRIGQSDSMPEDCHVKPNVAYKRLHTDREICYMSMSYTCNRFACVDITVVCHSGVPSCLWPQLCCSWLIIPIRT